MPWVAAILGLLVWISASVAPTPTAPAPTAAMLIEAAAAADIDKVEALPAVGLPVDARGDHGVTALLAAAAAGRTEMTKLLLIYRGDPSAMDWSTAGRLGCRRSGAHS